MVTCAIRARQRRSSVRGAPALSDETTLPDVSRSRDSKGREETERLDTAEDLLTTRRSSGASGSFPVDSRPLLYKTVTAVPAHSLIPKRDASRATHVGMVDRPPRIDLAFRH